VQHIAPGLERIKGPQHANNLLICPIARVSLAFQAMN
jgi:hypothetical protein